MSMLHTRRIEGVLTRAVVASVLTRCNITVTVPHCVVFSHWAYAWLMPLDAHNFVYTVYNRFFFFFFSTSNTSCNKLMFEFKSGGNEWIQAEPQWALDANPPVTIGRALRMTTLAKTDAMSREVPPPLPALDFSFPFPGALFASLPASLPSAGIPVPQFFRRVGDYVRSCLLGH